MTPISIISANIGDYDTIKPITPQEGAEVKWVMITDDEKLASGEKDSLGWHIIYMASWGAVHPNRLAKEPKLHPLAYDGGQHRRMPVTIWLDASFQVTSPTMAIELASFVENEPLAQFSHPWRDCIYKEAEHSVGLAKYDGEPIAEQVKCYQELGHPASWGLWATGLIVSNFNQHKALPLFYSIWEAEISAWSFQDQISQPYALRETGLRPVSLPGDHFHNPWVRYEGSGRH